MSDYLEYIIDTTYKMKVGERLDVNRLDLPPSNPLSGETGLDRLKSNIVGSAWNFKFTENSLDGQITIERIDGDGKRRHVDHDRQHLFNKMADDTYEPISPSKAQPAKP